MKLQKTLLALALIANAVTTSTAKASLFDRGNGLIYDDVSNITFTSDANLFKTQADGNANLINQIIAANNGIVHDTPNVYDTAPNSGSYTLKTTDFTYLNTINGQMNWWGAKAWIGYLNKINYDGYNNWSLPTIDPTDKAHSQMGELFYNELGGVYLSSITFVNSHNANYNLFSNVQSYGYWSSNEFLPPFAAFNDAMGAWVFKLDNGLQGSTNKTCCEYAWAVRSGDVSAVPVPGAVWLFGTGIIGLLSFRSRSNIGSLGQNND